jgi:CxxC motif-containing protein
MSDDTNTVREVTCVNCPMGCLMSVQMIDGQILSVQGQQCARGEKYAQMEIKDPRRMLTTLVVVQGLRQPLPVRTRKPIPKTLIFKALAEIHRTIVSAPIQAGAVIVPDICGTGIDIIATADLI